MSGSRLLSFGPSCGLRCGRGQRLAGVTCRSAVARADAQGRLFHDFDFVIPRHLLARRGSFPKALPLIISHGPRGAGGRLNRVAAWTVVTNAAHSLADRIESEGRPREARLLRDTTPHTFRHFVAMWLLNEGAQMSEVSTLLGHANTRITEQYYARHTDDRLQELHDQFAPEPEK